MADATAPNARCLVIGASHAGVNFAFALRRAGWKGAIVLLEADPALPYHRPPLSKTFLTGEDTVEQHALKPEESYREAEIELRRGVEVTSIDRSNGSVNCAGSKPEPYDVLVLATGGRAFLPPIPGLRETPDLFTIRTAADALRLRDTLTTQRGARVVIIGGGYIGLETAASLRKLDLDVTVLEREDRILPRIEAPEISAFFTELHRNNGVAVVTGKTVTEVSHGRGVTVVHCDDGSQFPADILIVGIGIRVNDALAVEAGLEVNDGIRVDASARTSDESIYAIGDCADAYHSRYNRSMRLESVQNAIDQAKVAAATIAGQPTEYSAVPWFWSDQYDVKLQMVGLPDGHTHSVLRREAEDGGQFSVWYFRGEELLAVHAVNHPKAYVLGSKFIRTARYPDPRKLADPTLAFHPANFT